MDSKKEKYFLFDSHSGEVEEFSAKVELEEYINNEYTIDDLNEHVWIVRGVELVAVENGIRLKEK